jgi:hypothetical protein
MCKHILSNTGHGAEGSPSDEIEQCHARNGDRYPRIRRRLRLCRAITFTRVYICGGGDASGHVLAQTQPECAPHVTGSIVWVLVILPENNSALPELYLFKKETLPNSEVFPDMGNSLLPLDTGLSV